MHIICLGGEFLLKGEPRDRVGLSKLISQSEVLDTCTSYPTVLVTMYNILQTIYTIYTLDTWSHYSDYS